MGILFNSKNQTNEIHRHRPPRSRLCHGHGMIESSCPAYGYAGVEDAKIFTKEDLDAQHVESIEGCGEIERPLSNTGYKSGGGFWHAWDQQREFPSKGTTEQPMV